MPLEPQPSSTPAVPAWSRGALHDAALASAQQALEDGIRTLQLSLPDHSSEQLLAYLQLLLRWNKVYNLTAVRDPLGVAVQHLLDTLTAVPALRRHTGSQATRVLDVGSGGGLPGVVWASACPEVSVTCVDTVAKKATFVRQVSVELGLRNLNSVHARVENLKGAFPLITARAFASLADIVKLTEQLLAPGGVWMALKGQHPQEEIDALPPHVEVFHVEQLQVPSMDAQRCIVWMRPRIST